MDIKSHCHKGLYVPNSQKNQSILEYWNTEKVRDSTETKLGNPLSMLKQKKAETVQHKSYSHRGTWNLALPILTPFTPNFIDIEVGNKSIYS